MRYQADVQVQLKPSVNDPQGLSIRGGLHALGFRDVEAVRAGKLIQLWLEAPDREAAHSAVDRMCSSLLANPVIEQYSFSLIEAPVAEQSAPVL